ncbi:hypothetical protein phiOC_p293 [Ochrobactrum phage vB_OspM_OC]|nr:hypothetical protein phiOC_p293 [Ochrobactrum phage vB_OspM_OC]
MSDLQWSRQGTRKKDYIAPTPFGQYELEFHGWVGNKGVYNVYGQGSFIGTVKTAKEGKQLANDDYASRMKIHKKTMKAFEKAEKERLILRIHNAVIPIIGQLETVKAEMMEIAKEHREEGKASFIYRGYKFSTTDFFYANKHPRKGGVKVTYKHPNIMTVDDFFAKAKD